MKGRPQFIALAAAITAGALLVPTAAAPSSSHATAGLPKAKVYDVRITGAHDTTFLNKGCDPYCADGYEGTHAWTQTFKNVRVTFKPWGATSVIVAPSAQPPEGTSIERYDHQSDFCKHETPAVTRDATLSLTGFYPKAGQTAPASLDLSGQSVGPERGNPVACQSRAESVQLASRVGTSLVIGSMRDGFMPLRFKIGTTKKGPGFPLDRLIAGKGFTISLKGKSIVNQEDLKIHKYANVTTGSAKVVFTPRARAVSRLRAPAAPDASRCQKTYVSWWSTKKRACFLITANAQWTQTKRWTRDQNGGACNGSLTTKMRWSSTPTPFWVGTTFPLGYSGTARLRTGDFFDGPARGTVERRATGGVYEFGCVAQLTKDCGKRPATFSDLAPGYAVIDGSFGIQPASNASITPFNACGAIAREPISVTAGWGGFVPFPVPAANGADLAKRLLAVRVGGSLILRGAGGPYPYTGSGVRETGSFAGKLVFKRIT